MMHVISWISYNQTTIIDTLKGFSSNNWKYLPNRVISFTHWVHHHSHLRSSYAICSIKFKLRRVVSVCRVLSIKWFMYRNLRWTSFIISIYIEFLNPAGYLRHCRITGMLFQVFQSILLRLLSRRLRLYFGKQRKNEVEELKVSHNQNIVLLLLQYHQSQPGIMLDYYPWIISESVIYEIERVC